MRIMKKTALAAAAALLLVTGCSSGSVGENPPKVSSNILTEKYTFKDNEKTFKIVYSDPWRAVSDDGGEGYAVALIPGEDEKNADIKLFIKSEDIGEKDEDLKTAIDYYSAYAGTGIVQPVEFKVKDADGCWLELTPVENSNLNVEGLDTEPTEEFSELGFVLKDSRAYVFKITAKDYQTYNDNEDSVFELLEGFDFI